MFARVTKSQLFGDDSIHQIPFENGTTHHSQTTWSWSWSWICCHFFFWSMDRCIQTMDENLIWISNIWANLTVTSYMFLRLGCLNVANHSNLSSNMVFSCLPCSLHLYAFNMTCFQRSWYLNSKGERTRHSVEVPTSMATLQLSACLKEARTGWNLCEVYSFTSHQISEAGQFEGHSPPLKWSE